MQFAFFIASKTADGTLGKPIGNDDGAIMFFEELEAAIEVKNGLVKEHGPLHIFRMNMSFAGEVLI